MRAEELVRNRSAVRGLSPLWIAAAAVVFGAAAAVAGCSRSGPVAVTPAPPDAPLTDPAPRPAAVASAPALHDDEEPHDDVAEPDEAIDDSGDDETPTAEEAAEKPHPLDGWSEERLAAAVRSDLASLGPMSLGSPNAGTLINGVQAVENPFYRPLVASSAWATQETLDYLTAALAKVHDRFPGTAPLALGDISAKSGGAMRPHISHQAGRDVDIAYFYRNGVGWYARGTAQNLDLPRNWSFVRALVTETDVDLILIDHSIQALLREYAEEIGEDRAWLDSVFRGVAGKLRPIIRHAPGHATHIHVRFYNPIAQETARRCYDLLVQAKRVPPVRSYLSHRVKKNETLGMISRKYGVGVPAIRAANGLRSSLIRTGRVLQIPTTRKAPTPPSARVRIPPRRIPPTPEPPAPPEPSAALQPPPTK